jgi:lipopolysaccharide biosynthesis glycosyltransferase
MNNEIIRIFVGTSEYEDKWIEKILAYTLHQNTDRQLEITFMRPSMFPDWNTDGWGTPFTCFRYAIPELCGFQGRAIYMDCDQMNFRDIGMLYDTYLEGCAFGMCWDTLNMNPKDYAGTPLERGWFSDSVIVIDCERAKEYIAPIEEIAATTWGYKNVFSKKIGSPDRFAVEDRIIKRIDARWNSFDGYATDGEAKDRDEQAEYDLDDIWHLHFTSLSSQPWHPKYNPHAKAIYKREDIVDELWRVNKKVTDFLDCLGDY